jgi:hypothetical protein
MFTSSLAGQPSEPAAACCSRRRCGRARSLICIQGESKLAILGTLADTEFDSLQLIKGRPTRLAVHE